MLSTRLIASAERPLLAALLEELLRHYAMPVPDRAAIEGALGAQPDGVEALVAFDEVGRAVGFASFAHIFPGLGVAPQLYMKELYVSRDARSGGVGEALLRALAREARARGCTRVDWTTQRDNVRGRAFYDRVGAAVVEDKIYFRLDEAALRRLTEP